MSQTLAPERRQKLPELFGAFEAAVEVGVLVQNLSQVAGLPDPACRLRATRVWIADDIREFAATRRLRMGRDTEERLEAV